MAFLFGGLGEGVVAVGLKSLILQLDCALSWGLKSPKLNTSLAWFKCHHEVSLLFKYHV